MDGFDVVVRVASLALASSAEGVSLMEDHPRRAATAYRIDVALVVLPEQVMVQETSTVAPRTAVVRGTPGIFRLEAVPAPRATSVPRLGCVGSDSQRCHLEEAA